MIIDLQASTLRSAGCQKYCDTQGETLLFPSDRSSELVRLAAQGTSAIDLESMAVKLRIPTLRVTPDEIRITSDYMGMRHMYLQVDPGSAIPSLRVADSPFAFQGRATPDYEVLRLVPAMKFIPMPLSCLRGVDRLRPGTLRILEKGSLRFREDRALLPSLFLPTLLQPPHRLDDLLQQIVEETEIREPQAHVFLSGGLDSALLVHLLRQKGLPVQAWTASFNSSLGRLEAERARASARFLQAQINVIDVDQSGRTSLTGILNAMVEPFADVALVAEAVLGQVAAAGGALRPFEGEGVDSLMCGSYKFIVEHYRSALVALTALVPDALVAKESRKSPLDRLRLKTKQMKALAHAKGTDFERHLDFLTSEPFWSEAPPHLREGIRSAFRFYYDLFPETDRLNRLAAMTFWGNIPNLENRKLDLVERYAGLRFNLPFQDVRFIQAALSIPSGQKVQWGYGKWPMRREYRGRLPKHTLSRKKLSFTPPVLELLGPEHIETMLDPTIFGLGTAEVLLKQHQAGERDHLASLWAILVTNHWLGRFKAKSQIEV